MFLIVILATIVAILIRGFALVDLWAWFVMPLSTAIPALTFWHALGLALLTSYVTMQIPQNLATERSKDEQINRSLVLILLPLLVWGVGAIYHSFMV